jgi:Cu/Ag efflux protein CusF
MNRRYAAHISMAAVVGMLACTNASAQTPTQAPTTKPAAAPDPMKAPVTVTATIEAIDKTARLITLKGPKGELSTVYADQAVKRFDELKVGDRVSASYYESVAVNVRRPGAPAPAPTNAAVTAGQGARPGATAAIQDVVTVTVQAIDKANQSVTVKRQDGGIVSFRVQDPKNLEIAKVGDTVDITYTRALLVSVNPAK